MEEDLEAGLSTESLGARGRSTNPFSSIGSPNGRVVIKFGKETDDKVKPFLVQNGTENKENHQEQVFLFHVGEKHVNDKNKSTRPPKPPRSPIGPVLDAYDLKLIKEITQLAFERRLRIKRIKDLKKKRASKAASSSNNTFVSLIFTMLVVLIILFQGVCSRNESVMKMQTSSGPVLSPSAKELPSLHIFNTFSPTEYIDRASSEGHKPSTPFLSEGSTRENA